MRSKPWPGVLVALAALTGAAALAQTEPGPRANRDQLAMNVAMVEIGTVVDSRLDTSDRTSRYGSHYEDYAIRLNASAVMEIEVTGSPDLAVTIFQPVGGREDLLLLGQSGSVVMERSVPPVTFVAQEGGLYLVRVYGPEQTDYSIAFRTTQVPAPNPTSVAIGQTVNGTLEDGGPRTMERRLFQDYRLSGNRGDRLAIRVTAAEGSRLDLFLEIGHYLPSNVLDVDKHDDDFGNTLNPYILTAVPESGELIIRVRGLSQIDSGAYTLAVERLPGARIGTTPQRLRPGRARSDTLSLTDEIYVDPDRRFLPFKYFDMRGNPGETYLIAAQSAQFQPIVEVGDLTSVGFNAYRSTDGYGMLVSSPDAAAGRGGSSWIPAPSRGVLQAFGFGGGRRNPAVPTASPEDMRVSGLRVRLPASGRLLVRITAHEEGAVGAFDVIAQQVSEIDLVNAGLFTSERGACEQTPSGIERCDNRNTQFVGPESPTPHQQVVQVEGRQGIQFGVQVRPTGVLGDSSSIRRLRRVWRFPAPGLRPPTTGALVTTSEREISIAVDVDYYATYTLTEPWEIVPGIWTFEFWDVDSGARIFSQQFEVTPAAPGGEQ